MRQQPGMMEGGHTAKDAAQNVLLANCGSCHNAAALREVSGGLRSMYIDELVAAGLLLPLSSATSLVVQRMLDGSMPPAESGLPPVTEADIDTVRQYLDNPLFWSGAAPPAADAGTAPSGLNRDLQDQSSHHRHA